MDPRFTLVPEFDSWGLMFDYSKLLMGESSAAPADRPPAHRAKAAARDTTGATSGGHADTAKPPRKQAA
jgi:hypothetical protein